MELLVKNISKSFGKKKILHDISFNLKKNDIFGLIGGSGCGKSTLLKILIGYHKPDSGNVLLNSKDISEDLLELRKQVGYTTQENSFYEKLTIEENMLYYARLYGVDKKIRTHHINEILKKVRLNESKKTLAEDISGGMKRRLDFAISLIHNPKILILDEPTTGLDPILVSEFWEIVVNIVQNDNKIAIVTSHILSEIEMYCSSVGVMKNGKIVKIFDKKNLTKLEEKFKKIIA